MALGEFWKDYCTGKWDYYDIDTASSPHTYVGGYICPDCGAWVCYDQCHTCFFSKNKTEKAFRILKILVEEKVITEPDSYKKFCDLIEKIAEKL